MTAADVLGDRAIWSAGTDDILQLGTPSTVAA
jgi:hypothetical protein